MNKQRFLRVNLIRGLPVHRPMRPDMDKVIVERPRSGGGARRPKGQRKRERLAMVDLAPAREGYRRRWTSSKKFLNEHLAPLRRYLQSQVGRPWNKVHSEISQHIRLDSAVQSHVLDHLWDFVEVNARLVDGVLCNAAGQPLNQRRWWWRPPPLFYVCPKSGLLKTLRTVGRKRRPVVLPAYLVIDQRRQWRQSRGVWFEIELAPLAGAAPEARDVWFKTTAGSLPSWEWRERYGSDSYAVRKRQLGKREVRIAESRLADLAKAGRG